MAAKTWAVRNCRTPALGRFYKVWEVEKLHGGKGGDPLTTKEGNRHDGHNKK